MGVLCQRFWNLRPCFLQTIKGHKHTSLLQTRLASGKVKRERKRRTREEVVYQYASKNTKRSDRVYVWGYAATGALGVRNFIEPTLKAPATRNQQHIPHRMDFWSKLNAKVHDIACGYGYSLYVTTVEKKNVLYGTGINTDSQLGFQRLDSNKGKSADYIIEPSEIQLPLARPEVTKINSIACGRAHTVVVTDTEGVLTFGHNGYGQCGRRIIEDEDYRNSQTINKIDFPHSIKKVVCGQDHTLFLTSDGRVYGCGLGSDGQTGLGHYNLTDSPTRLSGDIEGEHIVDIACKADCVLAVSDKGQVFGWGNNEYNQLAIITKENTQINVPRHLDFKNVGQVKQVTSAGSMCALLNDKGEVYAWGYGILGKGPTVSESELPTLIPPTLFGKNELMENSQVAQISCGMNYFAAITNDGHLYTWGRNNTGCLGIGHSNNQLFPFKVLVPAEARKISCGVDHTVVLTRGWI